MTPNVKHNLTRRELIRKATTTAAGLLLPAAIARPALAAPDSGRKDTTGHWFDAAPLPLKTQELYPAVHNNALYVAGGIASRLGVPYFTDRVVAFDAAGNAWNEAGRLPENLHHAALVATGDRLFLVGGFNGAYSHIWRMRDAVYELRDGDWQPRTNLPRPQAEGVLAAATGGAIHLVTGQSPKSAANSDRSDHQEVRDHWVSADGAQSWEALAPIPTARNSATGGWLGDVLVVTGGRTSSGNLSVTEIYDAREDRWRVAAPLPSPQAGTASVVVGDSLLVFGGEIFSPEADVFATNWRYQLSTDQWLPIPDLPVARHGLGAGCLGDAVYVVGGATKPSGRGTSDLNQALLLSAAGLS